MSAKQPNTKNTKSSETTESPAVDMESVLAKAKEEAEKQAKDEASRIIAEAKREAERIVAEARSDGDDVVSMRVTKKDLIEAYDSGMCHVEISKKFYGSASDENMAKISKVINAHFHITDNDDLNVEVVEPGAPLSIEE